MTIYKKKYEKYLVEKLIDLYINYKIFKLRFWKMDKQMIGKIIIS